MLQHVRVKEMVESHSLAAEETLASQPQTLSQSIKIIFLRSKHYNLLRSEVRNTKFPQAIIEPSIGNGGIRGIQEREQKQSG